MTRHVRWRGTDGGSGCTNRDCPASPTQVSVLSRRELDRVYDTPGERDVLPFDFPLPEDCTHVCTACGWLYFGKHGEAFPDPGVDAGGLPFDFDADPELTIAENVTALIDAAPEGAAVEALVTVAERTIPGASEGTVRVRLEDTDRDDLVNYPADAFM